MNIASEIEQILEGYEGITLEEVRKASLMRRKDRKFLFSFVYLPQILARVDKDYRVLEINGIRTHLYRTDYYDTALLEMYHKHHRGKANRHKVRIREYGTSDLSFLEVKFKNAKGTTIKNRIRRSGQERENTAREEEFLSGYCPYRREEMALTLGNRFNRITLVSHNQKERITLDYNLSFSGKGSGTELELPGISIAEIKYEKMLSGSPFHAAIRHFRITPRRFSKYAIGMALLDRDLKQNRFKQRVRRVHKINNQFFTFKKQSQHA